MEAGLSTVFGAELHMEERLQQWKAGLPCALAHDLKLFYNGTCTERVNGCSAIGSVFYYQA